MGTPQSFPHLTPDRLLVLMILILELQNNVDFCDIKSTNIGSYEEKNDGCTQCPPASAPRVTHSHSRLRELGCAGSTWGSRNDNARAGRVQTPSGSVLKNIHIHVHIPRRAVDVDEGEGLMAAPGLPIYHKRWAAWGYGGGTEGLPGIQPWVPDM